MDRERISSFWRHWAFITLCRQQMKLSAAFSHTVRRARREFRRARLAYNHLPLWELPRKAARRAQRAVAPAPPASEAAPDAAASSPRVPSSVADLDALIAQASPVAFPPFDSPPSARSRIPACGVYLRTDFWARIESGGSYGHTCYVAKELAAVTERFVCFMAHRYRLLDDYGLRQVVIDPPSATASEDDIVAATPHFYRLLKPALRGAAAGLHLRAPVPGQLRGRAPEPRG